MPRIWTAPHETFTDEQIAALDAVLKGWQEDDNADYGWTGATRGPEFVEFWMRGDGADEVRNIVGEDDDQISRAIAYLSVIP